MYNAQAVLLDLIPVDKTETHMLQAVHGGYGEEGEWGDVYGGGGGAAAVGGGGGGVVSPSSSSALRPPASPNQELGTLRPGAYEFKPLPP